MFTKSNCSVGQIASNTICAFLCLLSLLSTNVYCSGPNQLALFDEIITKDNALGKDVHKYTFSSDIKEKNNVRNYIFRYQFKTSDPYHHYVCSISTAKAGRFIDVNLYNQEYRRLKEQYMKAYPDGWKNQLRKYFPKIGKRAQFGGATAGPGGAAYELLLTTSDGKYDVKIVMSNLLPDTIQSPDLDIEKIAFAISSHYDMITKND